MIRRRLDTNNDQKVLFQLKVRTKFLSMGYEVCVRVRVLVTHAWVRARVRVRARVIWYVCAVCAVLLAVLELGVDLPHVCVVDVERDLRDGRSSDHAHSGCSVTE
jgi:hypothetical protein